jgi:hypothetical protein
VSWCSSDAASSTGGGQGKVEGGKAEVSEEEDAEEEFSDKDRAKANVQEEARRRWSKGRSRVVCSDGIPKYNSKTDLIVVFGVRK